MLWWSKALKKYSATMNAHAIFHDGSLVRIRMRASRFDLSKKRELCEKGPLQTVALNHAVELSQHQTACILQCKKRVLHKEHAISLMQKARIIRLVAQRPLATANFAQSRKPYRLRFVRRTQSAD